MIKRSFTCPFTGAQFEALESSDGNVIVQNPITGETMRLTYDAITDKFLIDAKYFDYLETVNCSEAAELLGVSRSRISKIVLDGIIPHFLVNGKPMFIKSDIIRYAETRTVGRPSKENNDGKRTEVHR